MAGDGSEGIERQIGQMLALVKSRVDLIIVQPTDNAALTAPLRAANRAGIPVVAYDQYISGGELAAFVQAKQREYNLGVVQIFPFAETEPIATLVNPEIPTAAFVKRDSRIVASALDGERASVVEGTGTEIGTAPLLTGGEGRGELLGRGDEVPTRGLAAGSGCAGGIGGRIECRPRMAVLSLRRDVPSALSFSGTRTARNWSCRCRRQAIPRSTAFLRRDASSSG